MAFEKVTLNALQEKAQRMAEGLNGMITLADFWATAITCRYDKAALRDILATVLCVKEGCPGWERVEATMMTELDETDTELLPDIEKFCRAQYETNADYEQAKATMMTELLSWAFSL